MSTDFECGQYGCKVYCDQVNNGLETTGNWLDKELKTECETKASEIEGEIFDGCPKIVSDIEGLSQPILSSVTRNRIAEIFEGVN